MAIVFLLGSAAHAQTAPSGPARGGSFTKSDAQEAAEAAQDQILVTAHLQHGAVATEVPPEVTLDSTVIKSLGAADLTEVFRELAPEIGGNPTGSPTAVGTPPVVLVNGQRIAGFSSIKDFPPEAVRRIEVFPTKVALQYGYGADQRVVNVVLRDQYRALTLLGRYTVAPDNWRNVLRAKVDLIRIGEDSHWNLALDYSHQDPIYSATTLVGPPVVLAPGASVPRHTLAAQDDHLTLSGAATQPIGTVSAELTGSLDLEALQSRPGLSESDGELLASQGLADMISGPFARSDRTAHALTNLTLNGKTGGGWRWSVIGRLDESTRETHTDALATANDLALELPSPGLLGERCKPGDAGCVTTTSRSATVDAYLNGDLFRLPAGGVATSLRAGFVATDVRGDSAVQSTDVDRTVSSISTNIDVPILSRRSPIGRLAIGGNGEARHVSAFGTLGTYGATLDWSPVKRIDLIASFTRARQAPTLFQLGEAGLATPDLREYDFASGSTTIVQRIDGGNLGLIAATSHVTRVRLQVTPLPTSDLTLSAEYTRERVRDPIVSLSAATAAAMAAFPDLFTRRNGYLTSIDVRPVNAARRDDQQIRWGATWSTPFGPSWAGKGSDPSAHNQFQIALYDTWRFQDDLQLRDGVAVLNLLEGDTISDQGASPRHRVEVQSSVSTRPFSADVSAVWQAKTKVQDGAVPGDELTFSQGVTLNLRFQLALAQQHWLMRIAPWLRGSLNLSADNILGAHTEVHDRNGMVPTAYSESYLNPTGRSFRITLRKRFHA